MRFGLVAVALVLASGAARAAAPVRAQEQQLVAPMRGAGDLFGVSAVIDGELGAIGAPQRAVGVHAFAGEVYLLQRSAGTWAVTGSLPEVASAATSRDLGRALGLRDGLLAVGAPGHSQSRGGVYIYAYSPGTGWVLQALVASPEGLPGARLGVAVDCADGLVLAGETVQTLPPADAVTGKVHVFDQAQGWMRVQVLTPQDAEGGDRFGTALAIAGELAVVGAPGKDGLRGAAYVFSRAGGTWTQTAKLVIADERGPGDYFGAAVAIEGERVLVGAFGRGGQAGAAFVFAPVNGKWTQVQALTAEAPLAPETFGGRVALAGGRALVSGWGHEYVAEVGARGGAYLFGRGDDEQDEFRLLAALRADDGVPGDYLGIGAALSADAALLGAPFDDAPAQPTPMLGSALGSAYVFALAQAAGEPCARDGDCAGGHRCCDAVCAPLAECEAASTGEPGPTGSSGSDAAADTGETTGVASTSSGGQFPQVEIDPRTDGCACAPADREIAGVWLGLWALGWRRRRR